MAKKALPAAFKGATFSADRKYRYRLWRMWATASLLGPEGKPPAIFIGLNPSTANEHTNDPTIRRCVGFAKSWGCRGMYMLNLFALVSTDPAKLKDLNLDPIGPDNNHWLQRMTAGTASVVACWGTHGDILGRGSLVASLIPGLQCFGFTKDGHPKHPLYLPKAASLQDYYARTV